MKKPLTILQFLIATFLVGCISYPNASRTPGHKGRVVYSATMIFPDKTTVEAGDPVANVPIRISMAVIQKTDAFGDGGPRWKTKKAWIHYTFSDTNGYFHIPSLWGFYISTRGVGTRTERSQPQFAILEATGNVTVEEGADSILPYIIIHPSEPLSKSLSELETVHATPLHHGDDQQLIIALKELNQ